MVESFEERYGIKESENTAKTEHSESFVFPKESSETKKAIDKAETKINWSVKLFANNLDEIEPWLTKELLDIFESFQNDPKFSGLSESDLWLHSLGKLYETNQIPAPLEKILSEMMQLLNEYKTLRHKSQTLYDMLRACACADANNSDWDISWLTNQTSETKQGTPNKEPDLPSFEAGNSWGFKPQTSWNRWRWRV